MAHRVGGKGQVVIPKELRDRMGIEPGDHVHFWLDGDHLVVEPERSLRSLKGLLAGRDLVGALERGREEDRRREAAR